MKIEPETDLLCLIDLQPDFMPGGALPVPEGDAVLPVIGRLLRHPFRHAVATQDWHPPGHLSFASSHPGRVPFETLDTADGSQTLWPDHCVQGSAGARLHPDLDGSRVELIVRKGFRAGIDSYSAFRENDRRTGTGLDGWIRARGFRRVFLCGLAFDYCVLWSALDAVAAGFATVVIADACRAIALPLAEGGTTATAARQRMAAQGIRLANAADLD